MNNSENKWNQNKIDLSTPEVNYDYFRDAYEIIW